MSAQWPNSETAPTCEPMPREFSPSWALAIAEKVKEKTKTYRKPQEPTRLSVENEVIVIKNFPYERRNEVKHQGFQWDPANKCWVKPYTKGSYDMAQNIIAGKAEMPDLPEFLKNI